MNEEEHELEYLLCAKFHDDDFDDRGYVITIWTSVTMLKTLQEPPGAPGELLDGRAGGFRVSTLRSVTGGNNRLYPPGYNGL